MGDNKCAVLVIPGDAPCFEAQETYSKDGITEKVKLTYRRMNKFVLFSAPPSSQ